MNPLKYLALPPVPAYPTDTKSLAARGPRGPSPVTHHQSDVETISGIGTV